jgi:hypothetical protein
MSVLIEGLLAQVADKADDDTIQVRVVDLKVICSQATARAQMITIYEEILKLAAESMTTGQPNLDLAQVILRAIAAR